jgi:hypothetical protein
MTTNSTFIAPNVDQQAAMQRVLYPALNLNYAIRDMWGVEVMRVKRTDDLFKKLTNTKSIDATRIVDLYSTQYIITTKPISSPHFAFVGADIEGLEGTKEDLIKKPTIKIYRNNRALPRAFLASRYRVAADPAEALKLLGRRDFDPSTTIILEEAPLWDPAIPAGPIPKRPAGAYILQERNNMVEIETQVARPSILYLSDTFYPGWNAYVDGNRTKIYRADYNFRAIPLPRGGHRVIFRCQPFSFYAGAIISAGTLFILLCFGIWFSMKKRSSRVAAAHAEQAA